jgi:hypothetical protein
LLSELAVGDPTCEMLLDAWRSHLDPNDRASVARATAALRMKRGRA